VAQVLSDTARPGGATLRCDHFQRMRDAFAIASERTSDALRCVAHEFAARPVHLRIVGSALAQAIEPAFSHLVRPSLADGEPALRIDVWDEDASGVPCPLPLTGGGAVGEDGRLVGFGSAAWRGIFDRGRAHLVAAVRAEASLSLSERGHPFSPLLMVWYLDRGLLMLHAAVVAAGGRGVLIAGGARSGKSTTAYACTQAGFALLADDCTALALADGGAWKAYSVYRSLLVDARALRLFTGARRVAADGRGRVLVYAERADTSTCVDVSALLLARVVAKSTSALEPLRRAEALRELLPSVVGMAPLGLAPRRGFAELTALVDHVPSQRLLGGSDWRVLPDAVSAALR